MNYFQFHIGDYTSHTAHLEPMEDLAYRRMMDMYYMKESPLPEDPEEVCRLIRLRGEKDAVCRVLMEFFTLSDDGWRHQRCDEEIEKVGRKSDAARASANKRWESRNASAEPLQCERNAESVDSETASSKEEKKSPKFKPHDYLLSLGVPESVASDWLAHRKTLKAAPTETAINSIADQAVKAGISLSDALSECCQRGWRGFKAEWIANRQGQQKSSGSYHDMLTNAAATMYGTNRG